MTPETEESQVRVVQSARVALRRQLVGTRQNRVGSPMNRREFIKLGLGAAAAVVSGAPKALSAAATNVRHPRSERGEAMSESKTPGVRGYLLHLTHYDPSWFGKKSEEKPFDLDVGLEIVAALEEERFNLLAVDCADAVQYESHPELARHYTVPMEKLERLAVSARDHGLDVVPKLNFSRSCHHHHNDWMLGLDEQWDHHFDDDAYWQKAFELIDELVAVCRPKQFFHVGMDEDHDRSYTQYIAAIERLRSGLNERNLRTVIWNDTAINYPVGHIHYEKSLTAEKEISKDIVQILWDYHSVPAEAVGRIRERGFELWGAPGSHDRAQARKFRDTVLGHGGTGLFMTTWSHCNDPNRQWLLNGIREMGPVYRGEE